MFDGARSVRYYLRMRRSLSYLTRVSPSTVDHLRKYGFAIQDGVIALGDAKSFLHEAQYLIRKGLATPNKTHVVSSKTTKTFEKSAVLQTEIHVLSENHLRHIPSLAALQSDSSLCAILSVLWPRLTLRDQSVKIQRASGRGACFPIHIDTSPPRDSRIVTALLYAHDSWTSSEGALRIYKTPISFIDVDPLPGRLVLLAAALMHHRVMPSDRDRYAITLWLSGTIRSPKTEKPDLPSLSSRIAYQLLAPNLRDMAFRITLESEWIASLHESHHKALAHELVQDFRTNLTAIRKILPGILQRQLGLQGRHASEVEAVLSTPQSLKEAYQEMEDVCGLVPFVW